MGITEESLQAYRGFLRRALPGQARSLHLWARRLAAGAPGARDDRALGAWAEAQSANPHTRRAALRAARRFLRWLGEAPGAGAGATGSPRARPEAIAAALAALGRLKEGATLRRRQSVALGCAYLMLPRITRAGCLGLREGDIGEMWPGGPWYACDGRASHVVGPALRAELRAWLSIRAALRQDPPERVRQRVTGEWAESPHLFPDRLGRPVGHKALRCAVGPALRECGLSAEALKAALAAAGPPP